MADRRLVIATHSAHKLAELRVLLDLRDTELVSLADMGVTLDAPEDEETFDGNATSKALTYARLTGMPTLADDSGVEVDALGGRPGVRTRRYAGPNATDAQNNEKLLRELEGIPPERRTARYRCSLAFVDPADWAPVIERGTFEGRIALAPRGSQGFGYDPIFEPASEPAGGRTVGEWSADEKNRHSHRAVAARAMAAALRQRGW